MVAMGICCDFGEGDDFALGAGLDDAVAGEDDGLLGCLDELDGFADAGGLRRGAWVRAVGGGAAASKSKGAVACCASLVMSTRTGPGRPERGDLEGQADGGRRCLRRG